MIGIASFLALAASAGPDSGDPRVDDGQPPLVVTRLAMGVRFQIALVGDDDLALERLAVLGLEEVDRLEAILNNWSPDSDITRLNRAAGVEPVDVAADLANLLGGALSMHQRTGGAYDVTVGGALRRFGFDDERPRVPTEAEHAAMMTAIGSDKLRVTLAPPTVTRLVEGIEIDVSSAAKGMAVDAVAELLRAKGVVNAFIAAGGSTVYAIGDGPDGGGWPFRVAPDTEWRLRDEAVSTSGRSYRDQELDGRRLSHIFDPRTGRPAERGVAKACFRGPSAFVADMASTALVVLGHEGGRAWFERDAELSGCVAWLETDGGVVELAPRDR